MEDKFTIYTFNTNNEEFSLFDEKIFSVDSYNFINNTLLILDKSNLLKAYNLDNKKIFWQINLSDVLSDKDEIVQSFVTRDSMIIFFSKGIILQLNILSGEITFKQNLKLSKIIFY